MTVKAAAFAAFLALSSVAITNFSSFLLGGITEDLADMITLQTLMNYSLSDIPGKLEREKSLMLVKHLFTVLHKDINRSNLLAALLCGTTSFMAGIIPIMVYFCLTKTPKHYRIPRHSCHSDGFVSGSLPLQKIRGTLEGNVTRNCRNCHDRCHCFTADRRHRLSLEASTKSRWDGSVESTTERFTSHFALGAPSTVWPNLRLQCISVVP